MQLIETLKQNPEQWHADNAKAAETVIAEILAAKEARGGKPVVSQSWRFANSNPCGGGL
jgi:hypothetical protein